MYKHEEAEDVDATRRSLSTFCVLVNSFIDLIALITQTGVAQRLFIDPSLVSLFAGLLNLIIGDSVADRVPFSCIPDPDRIMLRYREWACVATTIFVRFSHYKRFIAQCTMDQRSFSLEGHAAVLAVLPRVGVLEKEQHGFAQALQRLEEAVACNNGSDTNVDDAEEIPAHFIDPITCEVMEKPMRLPSGNIVDRSSISRHLLTSNTDPFTRVAMSSSDVEPCPELEYEIYIWRQGRQGDG